MQVGCIPVLGGFCDSDVESNRRKLERKERLGLTCGDNRKEEKLWSGHCCDEVMESLRGKKCQERLEGGRWMCVAYSSILGMKYGISQSYHNAAVNKYLSNHAASTCVSVQQSRCSTQCCFQNISTEDSVSVEETLLILHFLLESGGFFSKIWTENRALEDGTGRLLASSVDIKIRRM